MTTTTDPTLAFLWLVERVVYLKIEVYNDAQIYEMTKLCGIKNTSKGRLVKLPGKLFKSYLKAYLVAGMKMGYNTPKVIRRARGPYFIEESVAALVFVNGQLVKMTIALREVERLDYLDTKSFMEKFASQTVSTGKEMKSDERQPVERW